MNKSISKYLSSVGKLGKGKPKTMTPAARAARVEQMDKINEAKKKGKI